MNLYGMIDLGSRGQPEIQMEFPLEILAKGSLRYDPPLNATIIAGDSSMAIRVSEFGITARGKSLDEAERRLHEETSDLLRRSKQKPPDLTQYEARVVEKMRSRSNRPGD